MKLFTFMLLFVNISVNAEQPFGQYNQQYTINQQYGSTNWYSSPLGMGVAQAGVTLMGGLINAMNKSTPTYVQPQQQPIYVNQNPPADNCHVETLYEQNGNPRTVRICP